MMNFANIFAKKKSKIIINGVEYSGKNVQVTDTHVTIDGQIIASSITPKISIKIYGDADSVRTTSGEIKVESVAGQVETVSGDVTCGAVLGDVTSTSGDIRCKDIGGNVRTVSGDIHKSFF